MTESNPKIHRLAGIFLLAGYLLFITLGTFAIITAYSQYKNLQVTSSRLTREVSQKLELMTRINQNSNSIYIASLRLKVDTGASQTYTYRREVDSLDQLNTVAIRKVDSLVSHDEERYMMVKVEQARLDYIEKRTNYLRLIKFHANAQQLQAAFIKVKHAFTRLIQREEALVEYEDGLIKSIAINSTQDVIHLGHTLRSIISGFALISVVFGITTFLLYRRVVIQYAKVGEAVKGKESANEQVIRNEKRFRALVEHGAEMISLMDKNGNIIYASPGMEQIIGYSADEITGTSAFALLHPEYVPVTKAFLDELMITPGVPFPRTNRFRHKNGGDVWVEGVVINLLGDENVQAIVTNYHDITERKQVEENLLQSEARLKEAQAFSHISNWEIDLLTNVNTWSDEFYNIFSIKRGDIQPSPEAFLALLHPEDVSLIRKIVEQTFQTFKASSFVSRIKTKDGSTRYIYSEWSFEFDKDKKPIRLYGILQDITERKNAEKGEAEIQERLKAIFNGTRDAILLADDTGKYVQVNPPAVKMLGYTEEELLNMTIAQIVSPKYSSMDVWSKFIEGGHQIGVIELIRKDGEAIICHYNSTANILPSLHLSILTDVTESKRAADAVIENEKKYRYLFENNPMLMWVFDKDDLCFLDVNEATIKHYGYTRKEFLGMSTLDIRPKDEVEVYKTYLQNNSGNPFNAGIWKHLKKDGSIIEVEIILHDIDFDQKKACLVLANDVTEKLKTEAEIKSSYQQLKDLTAHLQRIREEERTRIARKIHDDLGQQLTGLKMDASWIGKKITTEDKSIQEKLSNMVSLIDETVKTVRRISSELRPGVLDDLGLIPALEWQSEEFEKRTGIKSQFHTGLSDLNPEKNLSINIFRVYQESLTNVARHAQATHVETTLEEKDGYIILIIKDDGRGFDLDEVKSKKSLGLVGMRERALMFQGELTIQSEKLKGTVITLRVPLLQTDKRES